MGREGEGAYQEGGPWADEAERLKSSIRVALLKRY
jgi:hypothetical protein